ncbi:hypothetical protein D3C76_332210 [compost metagenome]
MVSPPMPQILITEMRSSASTAARPSARRTLTRPSRPFLRTLRWAEANGVCATSPATAASSTPRSIKATGR